MPTPVRRTAPFPPRPRSRRLGVLATLAALLVTGSTARAGEGASRTLDLPREGLSLVAEAGWEVRQPLETLLALTRGKASLWVHRDTTARDDLPGRLRELAARGASDGTPAPEPVAWTVKGAGPSWRVDFPADRQRRTFAFVAQPQGRRLHLEAALPLNDEEARAGLERLLATLDVTPYENAGRHVDLIANWSIDVPAGWTRRAAREGRTLFGSDEQPASLLAVRAAGSEAPAFEAEGSDLLGAGAETLEVAHPTIAGAARAFTRVVRRGPDGPRAFVYGEERAGFWVTWVSPDEERKEQVAAAATAASLRSPAEPGPRVAPAGERFERADAPKVAFRSPARWTKTAPSPGMRLAQYQVPAPEGSEAAECVVFFFGAAQGGSLEANLERWKRQFEVEGAPVVKTEAVAEGITATVLDVSGRYVAESRPGSGVKLDKPGWRMLAAMLLTPDGALYLKLVGPRATLDPAEPEFRAWVRSFRTAK